MLSVSGCSDSAVVTGTATVPSGSATSTTDPGRTSTPATATGSSTAASPTPTSAGSATTAAPASTPSPSPSTYRNATYGFSVTVPAGFSQTEAIAERGMSFAGPDQTTLKVYGSNNLQGSTAASACHEQSEGMNGRTEVQVEASHCTLSVVADGSATIYTSWVGTGSLNTVEVSRSDSAVEDLSSLQTVVLASFRPGDLTLSH